jgi:HTH-type transcriptional regulator/antitoxin HigA
MHISTLAEYDAAMARLDALMDAPEGTEEIDALADALAEYEAEHYPIDPPTPAAAAEFRREQEAGNDA